MPMYRYLMKRCTLCGKCERRECANDSKLLTPAHVEARAILQGNLEAHCDLPQSADVDL
jgi:hypothetical protein